MDKNTEQNILKKPSTITPPKSGGLGQQSFAGHVNIVRLRQPESSTFGIRDIFPYLGHARAHDNVNTEQWVLGRIL